MCHFSTHQGNTAANDVVFVLNVSFEISLELENCAPKKRKEKTIQMFNNLDNFLWHAQKTKAEHHWKRGQSVVDWRQFLGERGCVSKDLVVMYVSSSLLSCRTPPPPLSPEPCPPPNTLPAPRFLKTVQFPNSSVCVAENSDSLVREEHLHDQFSDLERFYLLISAVR